MSWLESGQWGTGSRSDCKVDRRWGKQEGPAVTAYGAAHSILGFFPLPPVSASKNHHVILSDGTQLLNINAPRQGENYHCPRKSTSLTRAPFIKFLLKDTNVEKVSVSSRPDTFSSSKTLGPPPWIPYMKTSEVAEKLRNGGSKLPWFHSRVQTDQCVWRHWGIHWGGSKQILVEPKSEDHIHRRRLWSVNPAEFWSLPLWPSFDHWPLQQNTNHKFMHYYLSAARGIRSLSAWTASWLFTHMTPGNMGLAAEGRASLTVCALTKALSLYLRKYLHPAGKNWRSEPGSNGEDRKVRPQS